MKTLRVEGWRFIPHSYAIVNQWQLLSLLKRKDIALTLRDLPYFKPRWKPKRGLFSPDQERALSSIPLGEVGDVVDCVYKISFPYDFMFPEQNKTVVFATSELKRLDKIYFQSPPYIKSLAESHLFSVVTPSRWSREGFLNFGLREDQVIVVPLGIDPESFSRPSKQARCALRANYGVTGFVFCNVSAMTGNKGIDILLRAFATVAQKYPDVRLHLKGTDELYKSESLLKQTIENLPIKLQSLVIDRLLYFGDTISIKKMAEFYQLADVYVSPYRAEGFNLPALEACACGTPVICTKGGSTDDFMKENFARFIDSKITVVRVPFMEKEGFRLAPDLDHLIYLMLRAIDGKEWHEQAAIEGARHAAMNYSWDSIVNNLLGTIFTSAL